jgi:redox-sensitive bicupin YhaK (pirin superfamily)
MKTIIHKADSRGNADYGWLKTKYTFSFANYYDPTRINFGALRVLNDDYIAGGEGFGKHPHDNMEIITIPTSGELLHTDSMGHSMTIGANEVQVMTAGTGIFHAELNNLPDTAVTLFQIWIFPDKKNLKPRYDQKKFDPKESENKWQCLVAPTDSNALMIHQQAWFYRASLSEGRTLDYKLNLSTNGVYLFVVDGEIELDGTKLESRDGIGIWETSKITIKALKQTNVLLMEIPMEV